jgi:precorrin-6B methylase 1
MEFSDIIVAIAGLILFWAAVLGLYVLYQWHKIKQRVDDMIQEVVREAEANMIGLSVEVDKNIYFCYNNEDKTFVCQGTTVEEIKQAFHARYPDKIAYLADGDPGVVEHFKTELRKLAVHENSTSK